MAALRDRSDLLTCAKLRLDNGFSSRLSIGIARRLEHMPAISDASHGGLRRGFTIKPGERVLLVDDILTTGGSVRETMEVVWDFGGNLVGIAVLADRTNGKIDFGIPFESLLKLDVVQYKPDECPLCAAGIPLTKRGSTPKPQENLK